MKKINNGLFVSLTRKIKDKNNATAKPAAAVIIKKPIKIIQKIISRTPIIKTP
ncbi:MAG: hypothetical protein IKG79_04505 [Neisseriaceae bacterium]|nr:hypothetical protein [Neisseriaceae bacterium]